MHTTPLPRFLGATLLLAGMVPAVATASAPNLSVAFVEPEKYVDAGYSSSFPSERDRAEVQRDVEQHLSRLAERGLPTDAALKIEVLDIDLAGRFEPWNRAGADLRIVRDTAGPRFKLRYTLTRGGQVVARDAEEQVTDMNFLASINRYSSGDRLRYEKALLDGWFEKRVLGR